MRINLNLDLVEDLAVVDSDNSSNHFRDDDHITKMSLDASGLLVSLALKLSLTKALDESEGLALKATVEAATSTAVNEVDELFHV